MRVKERDLAGMDLDGIGAFGVVRQRMKQRTRYFALTPDTPLTQENGESWVGRTMI